MIAKSLFKLDSVMVSSGTLTLKIVKVCHLRSGRFMIYLARYRCEKVLP